MHQPRASIVIPVYNAEKYLDRCIESAVNQTYKETEIILIDDGSTDLSPFICERWAEKYSSIKVIHKSNEGAGLARNAGLDAVTGDYVLFVDSDDYILPETVQKCIEAAVRDGSEIVLYGKKEVDLNGRIKEKTIRTEKLIYKGTNAIEDLLSSLCTHSKGFGLAVWGKLIKTSAIEESGACFFSERQVYSEDALFITELFSAVRSATILPEYLYMYVIHKDSLSNILKKDYHQKNNVFLEKAMSVCKTKCYSDKVKNHLKARFQIYSLAGMKNIMSADISRKEKVMSLKYYFNDDILRNTLTDEVLRLGTKSSLLFWKMFRLKMFSACQLLLFLKTRK